MAIIILLIILLVVFLYYQDNDLIMSSYSYKTTKIDKKFDGYTIIQVSDFHNKKFGNIRGKLIDSVTKSKPDLILVTGDFISSNSTDIDFSISCAGDLSNIAKVVYVTGNHEKRLVGDEYKKLMDGLSQKGFIILDNEYMKIGDSFYIIGLDDTNLNDNTLNNIKKSIPQDAFNILLAHQPQYINNYSKNDVDIVFCGHAHGGQVRIPFTRQGIYSPGQGFLPKYTSGEYKINNTTMIVSRGVSDSGCPLRLFNKPEIVKLTINT